MAIGALAFRLMMVRGFDIVLTIFACVEFGVGSLALYAFRAEAPANGSLELQGHTYPARATSY